MSMPLAMLSATPLAVYMIASPARTPFHMMVGAVILALLSCYLPVLAHYRELFAAVLVWGFICYGLRNHLMFFGDLAGEVAADGHAYRSKRLRVWEDRSTGRIRIQAERSRVVHDGESGLFNKSEIDLSIDPATFRFGVSDETKYESYRETYHGTTASGEWVTVQGQSKYYAYQTGRKQFILSWQVPNRDNWGRFMAKLWGAKVPKVVGTQQVLSVHKEVAEDLARVLRQLEYKSQGHHAG